MAQLNDAFSVLDQEISDHAVETASGGLDLSALTSAQRGAAIERLHAVAAQLRGVMRRLISYSNDHEYLLQTPIDQLDEPIAVAKFMEIARRQRAAHPGINFAFSPK